VGDNSPSGVVRQAVTTARAQLDDLLAELEAGARFVDRIQAGIASLDSRLAYQQQQRDEVEQLIRRIGELRASVQQQRVLMKQLRACFDTLRREAAGRR
jgi:predicted RNase H-like nuclease (RuvC/YqgF family)